MFNLQVENNISEVISEDFDIEIPYAISLSEQSKLYCLGLVDMIDSTKIASVLNQKEIVRYYEIFINSMAKIIDDYNGTIIKNIGDCLVYYFPDTQREKEIKFSNCIECGLAMKKIHNQIIKKLKSEHLPDVNYRISADYGPMLIMNTKHSSAIDMIGTTLNVCSKINHYAPQNEFVIGSDLFQIIKKINKYNIFEVNSYSLGSRPRYPIYKIEEKLW